jgi:hypothetical protein
MAITIFNFQKLTLIFEIAIEIDIENIRNTWHRNLRRTI